MAELDDNLFRQLRYRFMANMVKMLDALRLSKGLPKTIASPWASWSRM